MRTLRLGSTGPMVEVLQNALMQLRILFRNYRWKLWVSNPKCSDKFPTKF